MTPLPRQFRRDADAKKAEIDKEADALFQVSTCRPSPPTPTHYLRQLICLC